MREKAASAVKIRVFLPHLEWKEIFENVAAVMQEALNEAKTINPERQKELEEKEKEQRG